VSIPASQIPQSVLRGRDELDPATIITGVIASLLLHGSIIGLVILGTMHTEEKIEEHVEEKMLEFEEVDLLALGEEKPPNQLPRISNVKPPEVKPDEVNIAKPNKDAVVLEKKEEEKPKEAEEKKDAKEESRKKLLQALSAQYDEERPANEEIPEGSAEGVVGGLSDAAKANLMGTYQAKLVGEISRNWTVPTTIPPEQIAKLQGRVAVYIRISEAGYVVSYSFKQRSGDEQFDDSIERVIKKFQVMGGGKKLPLPENPEIQQIVLKQGLNLKNWEYTGQ
jgi:TonB family protein